MRPVVFVRSSLREVFATADGECFWVWRDTRRHIEQDGYSCGSVAGPFAWSDPRFMVFTWELLCMAERRISIGELLTEEQIKQAFELYQKLKHTHTFAKTAASEIITPNLAEIERKAGQEMDATYVAYMLEYVFDRQARS